MVYRVVDLRIENETKEKFAETLEHQLESAAHELKAELGSGRRPKLVTIYREHDTIFAVFNIEFRQ